MTQHLVIPLPENEALATSISGHLGAASSALQTRTFPDGETYLRFGDQVADRNVILVCSLQCSFVRGTPAKRATS
ncbi:MAG TPA: ribose-phosphate pyrophosphokinase-like domain-containing protein [Promineifilum sp.]|nr:ribose-phosphate pyrophosphokinase-like domain-containing protein [Promineifilum sp.]